MCVWCVGCVFVCLFVCVFVCLVSCVCVSVFALVRSCWTVVFLGNHSCGDSKSLKTPSFPPPFPPSSLPPPSPFPPPLPFISPVFLPGFGPMDSQPAFGLAPGRGHRGEAPRLATSLREAQRLPMRHGPRPKGAERGRKGPKGAERGRKGPKGAERGRKGPKGAAGLLPFV